MKALLKSGLGIALGLWAAQAGAEDVQWRSSTRPPVAAVSPVRLGLPRATGEGELVPAVGETPTIVRAKAQPDEAKPLPSGPSLKIGEPKTLDPKTKAEFIPAMPSPSPGVGGHVVGSPVMGTPLGSACCDDGCGFAGPVRGWFRNTWTQGCGFFCGQGVGMGCEDDCCPSRPRLWVNGAYLLWSVSGQNTPPLVSVNANPAATSGNTVVLGGKDMENEWRSGARAQVGFWFPNHDEWGMDVGGFFLNRRTSSFVLGSDASSQITREAVNSTTGARIGELVSGVTGTGIPVSGSVRVDQAFSLWGVDAHLRRKAGCGPLGWVDVYVGYRHLNLNESLDITETPTATPTGAAPISFLVNDRFATRNQFNGVDFGLQFERRIGASRFFIQGNARIALGNMHQILNINGSTTRTQGGVSQTLPGGFLALSSNIGKYERNRFGVVPEVGLKIGYDVTERIRIFAGYDLLWMNDVLRAGEQIDIGINPGLIPFARAGQGNNGQNRPAVLFRSSDFWAQGGNFGIEWRY